MTGQLVLKSPNAYTDNAWQTVGLGFADVSYTRTGWLGVSGTGTDICDFWLANDKGDVSLRPGINGKAKVADAEIATATKPQEFNLPLAEGASVIGGYKNAYSKDQFGIVRVWFSVHFGSIPEVDAPVFTLPEGFRPDSVCDNAATLAMIAHYPALLSILASGTAVVSHGDIEQAGAINLHGYIEFLAAS